MTLNRYPSDMFIDRATGKKVSEQISDINTSLVNITAQQIYVEKYPRLGAETDDTERIKRAITDLNAIGGGELIFAGKTYTVSGTIYISSNTIVRGVKGTVINGSSMPVGTAGNQIKLFRIEGTLGTSATLTSSIGSATNAINVSSTANFAIGDLILVTSDELYAPGTTSTVWKKGELQIIESISGNQIVTKDSFLFSYDYTQNGKIQKVNAVVSSGIKDLKIIMGGAATAHNAISCYYTKDALIDNVEIDGAEDTGISLFYSWYPTVKRCKISNSTSPSLSSNPVTTTGYGISVMDATKNALIEENTFYNCRHGIAGGGARQSVLANIFKNKAYGCGINYAFDCHEPCYFWTFRHNKAVDCAGGIVARGQYITVEENDIINSTGRGIRVESYTPVTDQYGIVVKNNRIKNTADIGIDVDGYQSRMREVIVEGNIIDNAYNYAIKVTNFQSADVSRNYILNLGGSSTTGNGIYVGATGATRNSELTMSDNVVEYTYNSGYYVENVDRANLSSNKLKSTTNKNGMEIVNSNNVQLVGGFCRDYALYGIYLNGGSKIQLIGVACSVSANANGDGVRSAGVTDLSIIGGMMDSNPRFGIYVSGGDYVIIRGVNARNNTNATKISVDAAIVNKVVDGNIV